MIQRVPSSQAKLVINSNPLGQIKFKSKFVVWAWPDGLGHETIWDRSYKPWKQPGSLGYIGDEIQATYMGIIS